MDHVLPRALRHFVQRDLGDAEPFGRAPPDFLGRGQLGQVHVRDLATGDERAFDPHSGEKCNLLGFGATDERIVMSQYCGTYEDGVRDEQGPRRTRAAEQPRIEHSHAASVVRPGLLLLPSHPGELAPRGWTCGRWSGRMDPSRRGVTTTSLAPVSFLASTTVDLARIQFATTSLYHFLFVPLTLGLAPFVAVMQTLWHRTGEVAWLRLTRFFGTLMLINFAIGVATGLVQEFQFGMNWSVYSKYVGN